MGLIAWIRKARQLRRLRRLQDNRLRLEALEWKIWALQWQTAKALTEFGKVAA